MNILERIVADKRVEVDLKKSVLPLDYLRNSPMIEREAFSLRESLLELRLLPRLQYLLNHTVFLLYSDRLSRL